MRDSSDIDTQAGHWFARMRAADAADDRAAFEQWREADPRHAQAYAAIEEIWAITGGAKRERLTPRAPSSRAARVSRAWPVLLAACLIALLPIATLFLRGHPDEPATAVTVSAVDTMRIFRLRDGSMVTLDRHSRMTVALNDTIRRVDLLDGRARFIVAHDPAHPFVVSAAGDRVVARGTIFDVTARRGETRVTLIDGSVDISGKLQPAPSRTVRLVPGQTLIASKGATVVTRSTVHDAAWARARVTFSDRRLDEVVGVANRLGALPIRLADPHCAGLRVTGVFDVRDTAALALKLAVAFDLVITSHPDEIVLASKPTASDERTPFP